MLRGCFQKLVCRPSKLDTFQEHCMFFQSKGEKKGEDMFIWNVTLSGWLNTGDATKPGRASVSLIRPWLLPGLTTREWKERGWLHTAQPARKPPSGRANAGQVIWRLGCIKAIYKRLKDLRCFTHSVCAFIRPGTGLLSFLSINTKG